MLVFQFCSDDHHGPLIHMLTFFCQGPVIHKAMECLVGCKKLGFSDAPALQSQDRTSIPIYSIDEAWIEFENELKAFFSVFYTMLFKKKHLRGDDKTWWIPTFCSLCVQGVVRKSLLDLADLAENSRECLEQYFRLVIRLFSALSLDYDPLIETQSQDFRTPSQIQFWVAMGGRHWEEKGIKGSVAFVRGLFEMDAECGDQFSGALPEVSAGKETTAGAKSPTTHATRLRSLAPISVESRHSSGAIS